MKRKNWNVSETTRPSGLKFSALFLTHLRGVVGYYWWVVQ